MSKRDRQGARTPADLERKYEFGQSLSEMEEVSKKQSDQIARQNDTMNDFMASSYGKFASQDKDISNLEKNVSTLKQNVTSLQIRMTNAEKRDREISQSITGLANSGQSSSVRLSKLEATVTDLTARLKTAEETLADLIERVTALEST